MHDSRSCDPSFASGGTGLRRVFCAESVHQVCEFLDSFERDGVVYGCAESCRQRRRDETSRVASQHSRFIVEEVRGVRGLTADGSVTVDSHDAELARLFDEKLFEFLVAAFDPERDVHATPDRLVGRALVKSCRFVDRGVQEGRLLVGKG